VITNVVKEFPWRGFVESIFWSFAPTRIFFENRSKETRNLINVGQNLGHSLGNRERKILKVYIIIGRVVTLTNIQSEMEEKCVCVCVFLLKRDPQTILF
jgi:hypothetical protein